MNQLHAIERDEQDVRARLEVSLLKERVKLLEKITSLQDEVIERIKRLVGVGPR